MQTMLVVDDDAMVRATLRRMAEDIGYIVKAVPNGQLAADVCRGDSVDVALIDVIMPGEDGITTMGTIRRLKPRLPVIVMSGGGRTGNTDLLSVAEQAGADAILRKPFASRELVDAIDRAETNAIKRNPVR
jgi:two-component system, chemotaxis family, chemotaxis protein CheY